MNPSQSLELIQSMIDRSRKRITENGDLYLFWGWLTLILSLLHYTLIVHLHQYWGHAVWSGSLFGYIYQYVYVKKKKHEQAASTFIDKVMSYIWTAFLIGMIFIILTMPEINFKPYPWFILFFGIATFLSGKLLQFNALVYGAYSNILIAFVAIHLPTEWQMLALSLAIIFSYIIPGYLLKANPVSHV